MHGEAARRGYEFAKARIRRARTPAQLTVTSGQLDFEWRHFMNKARARAPQLFAELGDVVRPDPHPLFRVVDGTVASWEKGEVDSGTRDGRIG